MQTIETQKRTKSEFIETIPAPGVGNKESSISASKFETTEKRLQLGADLYEIIKSGECIVKCTHDDDGCIDGRCTCEILIPEGGDFAKVAVDDNKDNERAKLAGGGYVTALSMLQALRETGASPEDDIKYLTQALAKQKIYCGAHLGSNVSKKLGKTDCGANDKEDIIIYNGTQAPEVVGGVTSALVARSTDVYSPDAMKQVFDGWIETVGDASYLVDSNGVTRLDAVREGMLEVQESLPSDEKAAVIKNLDADHNEIRVVVMYEDGETFSQTKLRRMLMERHPDVDPADLPQVFVVDYWRIQKIARAVAELADRKTDAKRLADEIEKRYVGALQAGVAFQVATYATLTDGTLPVDIVSARL
jgi:hypothetical protein